jgi:hypothetical protein
MLYQTNCSEATCRIDISELSKIEIEKLEKDLMEFIVNDADKEINVNEDNIDKIRDTFIGTHKIFGKKIMKISGNFPYNSYDELGSFLSERKLKYEYDDCD